MSTYQPQTPGPTPTISELIEKFRVLNQRTKNRVRREFNDKFGYSDSDTTFQRLMERRLFLCYDEYLFLVDTILLHYDFYVWAKKEQ
ncbi:hypothetical protein FHS57_004763 [Runella defluvii]|uniref:Uncharacterized protein n=1 Tax=Runella defluvii TaxID=370973 RepID=A0A7W5ZPP4_9BACT|nr:hypothetical protein [Runella defluvii]MBB3840743.1 hypothetical protein [Runella defluvii]